MKYTRENAPSVLAEAKKEYEKFLEMRLNLNMSRGKPAPVQLDLSAGLLDAINSATDFTKYSVDYRNYGVLDGIPEAKQLFADLCGVKTSQICVMGNSSLNIMYDMVQRGMQFGYSGQEPMNRQGKLKWLCPAPGYDRHFAVTELFGFELVCVPMTENGPDMDVVEELVKDETVKGIWCVPKYSNPQGYVYSDETVERFAKLKPAAKDFRIYWDNAYGVHFLDEDVPLLNLLNEAEKHGNEDMVFMFGSTSKISFAGAGVAYICCSENNMKQLTKLLSIQTIGHNKVDQLAHVLYYKDVDGIKAHMNKLAAILKPKFNKVFEVLEKECEGLMTWTTPKGGYFISCDLPEGTAKRTVELSKQAGVVFTAAGATYPYKKDPKDSNVRIAPSYPPIEELGVAMQVFCCAAKIAWAEKILAE
ncbi:MAG: aminotransferase [Clostridia bacterium]|nr:aminotransferase [Clostridia bacterium]